MLGGASALIPLMGRCCRRLGRPGQQPEVSSQRCYSLCVTPDTEDAPGVGTSVTQAEVIVVVVGGGRMWIVKDNRMVCVGVTVER